MRCGRRCRKEGLKLGWIQNDKKNLPDLNGEVKDRGNSRYKDSKMFKTNTKNVPDFFSWCSLKGRWWDKTPLVWHIRHCSFPISPSARPHAHAMLPNFALQAGSSRPPCFTHVSAISTRQITTHPLQTYAGLPLRAFPCGSRLPFTGMFYTVTVLPSDHALPTGPTMKAVSSLLWSLSIQSLATSQSRNVCWKNKCTNQFPLLAGVVLHSTRRRENRTDKPARG